MIDSRELRTGVWVRSIHTGYIQVTLFMMGEIADDETYLDHLMPIPLSPYILEKAGFTNNGIYSFIHVHPTLSISVNNSTGEVYLTHTDENDSEADVPIPHIKSFHQIANLYYSLTGTELTIYL